MPSYSVRRSPAGVKLLASAPSLCVELIVYEGWPVALAGADGVHLHPALLELAELEAGHGLVRFACALSLHALEVKTGFEQGPFDQGRAERFARALLMPTEEFLAVGDQSDAELRAG